MTKPVPRNEFLDDPELAEEFKNLPEEEQEFVLALAEDMRQTTIVNKASQNFADRLTEGKIEIPNLRELRSRV